ncbi:MAG: TRAP transporter substrate-binding protein DctP [Mailhella sp.]|nr:TRAP transporter substrate-binding protein DctP [Mailhella sp.]
MNIRRILTIVSLSLFTAFSAYAAPLEMNFQSAWQPAQKQNPDAIEPWAKSFAEKSDGEMIMHVFYTGGLVESSALAEAIKSGMVDSGGWSFSDQKKTPYLFLTQLPYIGKDQAHAYRVFHKLIDEVPELRAELDSVGILLSASISAPCMIASRDTPIRSIADIKGKRVLCAVPLFSEYVEAWGGIPVSVSPGDVYVGLQRGMGEMMLCGISCVKGTRVHEVCKYATDLGMTFSSLFPYSMNRELFEKDMTPGQQALTLELSKDLGKKVLDSFLADVANSYKEFEAAGCSVSRLGEAEEAEFIKVTRDNIMPNLVRKAKEAGLADPQSVIDRYLEIAASVE